MEKAGSVAEEGSEGPLTEVLAAFWAATMDKGRLLDLSEACEGGRRCHDMVLGPWGPLEGDEGAFMVCGRSSASGEGAWFSLEAGPQLSLSWGSGDAVVRERARVRGLPGLWGAGESLKSSVR